MGKESVGVMKRKLYFNWSSGKDAALALYYLKMNEAFEVELLLTSINKEQEKVSMHGLDKTLLMLQAKSIGLPLEFIEIPENSSSNTYNSLMQDKLGSLLSRGFRHTAFGDIFLEDLRHYREKQLKKVGVQAHFPLWKKNTKELMKEFLDLGFKAVVVCANAKWFDHTAMGVNIDYNWLNQLPEELDPCGENGEFHTFCYDGPLFKNGVQFKNGTPLLKSYSDPSDSHKTIDFWFADLKPLDT